MASSSHTEPKSIQGWTFDVFHIKLIIWSLLVLKLIIFFALVTLRRKFLSFSFSMASSSRTEPKSYEGWTYDVFLSFAGKDTRLGFVGHLYRALIDKGIRTFIDDDQLRMGDSISDELLRSIEESMFAIVVFSENYAASFWCLDELVKIMDCHRLRGQAVIPVFYKVDPSHVRRQNGCFKKAFRKHEARYKNELEKVHRWKKALLEAANISGFDVSVTANGNESECIVKIVKEISSKCYRSSSADKNLVGITPRVREVKSLLNPTADKLIIGIWGMGGAGKTTLAWAVYNEIRHQFQGTSFVANIRENSKSSGLHSLQGKVLSDLLSERYLITSVLEGRQLMAERLSHKKILLVLDDVDDKRQLEALVGSSDWFGKGSRIIITTRDEHCLNLNGAKVDKIYKSVMLDYAEAIQLFSISAFGRSVPPEEHKEHCKWVVHYAAGLPLALKVLGSFLDGRNMEEWKSTLERLKVAPEDEVYNILKISFDGLRETDKKIFLDIACFFKGMRKDFATEILNSFGFFADIGISVLIQKSLVSVSKGCLCMHDRIQEMGWIIDRSLSSKPGEPSRLWLYEDARHVLTSRTGMDAIEGINLDLAADQREGISFSADTFKNMLQLRFLYLRSSNIIQLWTGRKNLDKLTYIDLSYSMKLRSTPDLKGTPNLKSLTLEGCWNLVEIHPSLTDHKQIVYLNLSYSSKLERLPSPMQMESLDTLNLSFCKGLTELPEISENMGKLLKLYLEDTSIVKLPESIENLAGLILMNLHSCRDLRSLPETIGRLKRLRTLDVSFCSSLEKLPNSLAQVQSLEELVLAETKITKPPYSDSERHPLLSYGFIKKLNVSNCNLSEGEFPGGVSALFSLEVLDLSYNSFKYIPNGISQLPRLKILDVSYCSNLEKLQGLPSGIAVLEARDCPKLTSFYDFTKYETLWKLNLSTDKKWGWEGWKESADLVLDSLLEGHLVANHRFSILLPGDNIPKWFSEHNDGQHMNQLQLPSGWCDGNILGFALSAHLDNYYFGDDLTIQFDMISGHMQHLKLTPPQVHNKYFKKKKRHVWLGFLSFGYFKLLFPQFKEEDWSKFEGSLSIHMKAKYSFWNGYRIAIRLVYKCDLKGGMTTIKNSAFEGVLDNSIGRPCLKYDDDSSDEDEEKDDYYTHNIYTAYTKQSGTMGAKLTFQL